MECSQKLRDHSRSIIRSIRRNKYLCHSFVEPPDMMNIYNGNVMTDGSGYAVVEMPAWFESLIRDFRYQLTPVGQFAR